MKKVVFGIVGLIIIAGGVYLALTMGGGAQSGTTAISDTVSPESGLGAQPRETGTTQRTTDTVAETEGTNGGKTGTTQTPTQAPTTKPVTTTPVPVATTPNGYTLAQVGVHATAGSCWTVIGKSVYDITKYIPVHPGGVENAVRLCGVDGTSIYNGQHKGNQNSERMLEGLRIGAYNS